MEMDVGHAGMFRYTILKELLCAFEAREEVYNYVLMVFSSVLQSKQRRPLFRFL